MPSFPFFDNASADNTKNGNHIFVNLFGCNPALRISSKAISLEATSAF